MSTQLRLRQDTAANIALVTPALGEPAYDTTYKRLRMGDGAKQGARPHALVADVQRQVGVFLTVIGDGTAMDDYDNLVASTGPAEATLALEGYQAGQKFGFFPPGENTGPVTIDIDALGAVAVELLGEALSGGVLRTARYTEVVYDGSAFQVVSGPTAGGLVPLARVSVGSAVAAVDFVDLPITDFDGFQIHVVLAQPSVDAVSFELRVRPAGGAFQSGASDYRYAFHLVDSNAGETVGTGADANGIRITNNVGNAAAQSVSAVIEVLDLSNTSREKHFVALGGANRDAGHFRTFRAGGSYKGGTGAIDGIRLFFASGNIAAGAEFLLFGIEGA